MRITQFFSLIFITLTTVAQAAQITSAQWPTILNQNQIFSLTEFAKKPYIIGADYDLQTAQTDVDFFVKDLTLPVDSQISVFHKKITLFDPTANHLVGMQLVQVAQGTVLQAGDPAVIRLNNVTAAIMPGDRVLPITVPQPLTITPEIPTHKVRAQIIAQVTDGAIQTGSVVILNYGAEQGAVVGDKLLLAKPRFLLRTSNPDSLHPNNTGELAVLRVFAQTSYAGVLNAKAPVSILERVRTP
jgi:hypothetical protein